MYNIPNYNVIKVSILKPLGSYSVLGTKRYFASCVYNDEGICKLWDTDVQAATCIALDDDSSKKTRAFKNLSN